MRKSSVCSPQSSAIRTFPGKSWTLCRNSRHSSRHCAPCCSISGRAWPHSPAVICKIPAPVEVSPWAASKTLSANLRNLTWRMNNLAQGEYTEADPYMGEFSATFNTLIHELSYKAQELNALIDEYKNQSRLDMLTNLPNRRAFFEVASREILFSRRGNSPLCLIMADIDCFKRINDTYGHPTGDYVLQTIAHRIQGALRVEDFCCRFGGEEFLILLREAKLQDAADIAERLRKSCCTPPPRRRRFLSAPFPSRTRLCTAPRRRAVTASVANADAPLCLTPSCLRRHDGANAVTPAQFHGKSAQTSAGADARHQGIRAPYLR